MMAKKNLFVIFLLLSVGLLVLLLPEHAYAANADTEFVSKIIEKFHTTSNGWTEKLKDYALLIFQWFATFEVCWLGIRIALGRENIAEAIKQFVMFVLMAGFFLAVIHNYHEWSWNLIDGLASIGDQIGAPSTAADAPFQTGLTIVGDILDKLDGFKPADSLGLIIATLILMVCFAFIAARMVLIKCEAMIAMTAALLLVGFGGSSLTKDYAVNVLCYVLSVAFKLFVMQMVLGIGMSFIREFDVSSGQLQDVAVVIGSAVVILALINSIPDIVAGIISGSHIGSGAGLGAATAAVGGAALGVGMGVAAGAGKIAGGLKNLSAASQMADMAGATGLGKLGHMAKNLSSARQEARQGSKPTGSSSMKERLAQAMQMQKKG